MKMNELSTAKSLAYTIGALLYSPATNDKIATAIVTGKLGKQYSLALCLEDSISDESVTIAENQIIETLQYIRTQKKSGKVFFKMPKLFIRVRKPEQLLPLYEKIADYEDLLTGFIFPKYCPACSETYNNSLLKINEHASKRLYMMPILESPDLVDLRTRINCLSELKKQIDDMSDYIINVRVGGNDFCKEFGIRRQKNQTIYEILAVSHILSDIITFFSRDYIVSGPVWEYFSGIDEEWKTGLIRELEQDKLNGFVGKTVIHPNQISVVNNALRVDPKDYEDALRISNWKNHQLQVGKSSSGERMNEVKTHLKWAEKIIQLGSIYGLTDTDMD